MLRLAQELRVPIYSAIGLVEGMIHWTARYAPAGNVGKWEDAVIARGLGWDREPVELVAALVRTGWFDEDAEHRLIVHDWSQHADDTVHRILARGRELFADGTIPNTKRLDKDEKAAIEQELAKVAKRRTRGARRAHDMRTPCALPFPAPPGPALPGLSKERAARAADTRAIETWFEGEFLPEFPEHRRTAQTKSARKFVTGKLRPDEQKRSDIMRHLRAWKVSHEWTKDGGEYVPGLMRFFEKRCHEVMPIARATPSSNGSGQTNGVRRTGRLRLVDGREVSIHPSAKIRFSEAKDAMAYYEAPDGTIHVKQGAEWI